MLYGAAREEALVPYEPLVDCLREPFREPRELPREAAQLAGLVPELAPRLGARGEERPLGAPSPGARLRLFDAFATSLDAIAGERPLLLILEDLHWAEAATIRLLVHLAGRPGGSPQMLIVTYRDTEIGERHPLAAGLADLHRALPVEPFAARNRHIRGCGDARASGRRRPSPRLPAGAAGSDGRQSVLHRAADQR